MTIRATIFVFLALFSTFAKADEASFVRDYLQIRGCKFDGEFIAQTLREGLERIAEVNPSLAQEIRNRSFTKNLIVYCDIGPRPEPIYFDPDDNSIHLRITNDSSGMTNSNFFHEFLHFAGLDHVPPHDTSGNVEVFYLDPVYSCHMTAFPQIARAGFALPEGIDPKIIPLAALKCATVSF